MQDVGAGDHKGRPYMSRPECVQGPGAGLVGDGLVPSRSEFMQDVGTGDHKGRPYNVSA